MTTPGERGRPTSAPERDYDHFADVTAGQSRSEWARRRRECPVSHSTAHGGFVLLTKYEDAYGALIDPGTFTSTHGVSIPPQPIALIPEDLDGPEHRKYRKPINPALAPQAVAGYAPWIREYAVGLLDTLDRTLASASTSGEIDAVADFARPLPQLVTLRLLGIPADRLELVSRTTTLLSAGVRDAEGARLGAELHEYLGRLIAEKRADPEATGLIATLTRTTIDDRPIPPDRLLSMVSLLLFGGLHTTTGAIASTIVWLAEHPEDRRRLREDPTLVARSIDEIIRFTSPSSHLGRVATRDTAIRGCPVAAGQRVLVGIGSGNHDPDKFDDPERLAWGRPAFHHLGFGMGPHRCVGSHLAKVMLRVALEDWTARYDEYRVADPGRLHWSGGQVRNLDRAPLILSRPGGLPRSGP